MANGSQTVNKLRQSAMGISSKSHPIGWLLLELSVFDSRRTPLAYHAALRHVYALYFDENMRWCLTKHAQCGTIGKYKFTRRVISASPINHEADSLACGDRATSHALRTHKFIRRHIEAVITRLS
jgi:hypothetical protein